MGHYSISYAQTRPEIGELSSGARIAVVSKISYAGFPAASARTSRIMSHSTGVLS